MVSRTCLLLPHDRTTLAALFVVQLLRGDLQGNVPMNFGSIIHTFLPSTRSSRLIIAQRHVRLPWRRRTCADVGRDSVLCRLDSCFGQTVRFVVFQEAGSCIIKHRVRSSSHRAANVQRVATRT